MPWLFYRRTWIERVEDEWCQDFKIWPAHEMSQPITAQTLRPSRHLQSCPMSIHSSTATVPAVCISRLNEVLAPWRHTHHGLTRLNTNFHVVRTNTTMHTYNEAKACCRLPLGSSLFFVMGSIANAKWIASDGWSMWMLLYYTLDHAVNRWLFLSRRTWHYTRTMMDVVRRTNEFKMVANWSKMPWCMPMAGMII